MGSCFSLTSMQEHLHPGQPAPDPAGGQMQGSPAPVEVGEGGTDLA